MINPIILTQPLNRLNTGVFALAQAPLTEKTLDSRRADNKVKSCLSQCDQLSVQRLPAPTLFSSVPKGVLSPVQIQLVNQDSPSNATGLLQKAEETPPAALPPVIPPSPVPQDPAVEENPIEIFFTQPGMQANEDAQQTNPDFQLAKLLDSAQTSIDIAAFDIDSERIAAAILRAKARNIPVRIVTDTDYLNEVQMQQILQAGIPVVDDQRNGLMHNKFVVVDHKTVWTGSFNFTENCSWKNNNNAIKIQSKDLATNFTREFEEMFVDHQFGKSSPPEIPFPSISVGKATIATYFAAEGGVAGKVEEALNKAQHSIKFMAFSFTHDGIGAVVSQKFNQEHVQVQGVFEKTGSGTQYSEYGAMKQQGMDVKLDGNKNTMHHKVFIIDDKTVITGSFNFSKSADQENDENLLIIEDPEVAKKYNEEFKRVYSQGQ